MSEQVDILRSLGVSENDIQSRHGTIRVHPASTHAQLLSYSEHDTVIPHLMVTNQLSAILNDAVGITTIPFLQKDCAKYIDPKIVFSLLPTKLTNVKYHAFSIYLEGDIINQLKNTGTDGQQGTITKWFFESCPSDDDEYDWSTVSGSSDITNTLKHTIVEPQTNKTLDEISQNISAKKGKTSDATAHWKTDSLGGLLYQVLVLLLTGGITTENGYDVTVNYEWRGSKTLTKHIDARVWIPVSGGIQWVWD